MGADIEKLATSAIENAIAKTDYITPYVNSGDKVPCWDGYFYAYTDTSKKNEFFVGKAPVQVKGQKCIKLAGTEHKYMVIIIAGEWTKTSEGTKHHSECVIHKRT